MQGVVFNNDNIDTFDNKLLHFSPVSINDKNNLFKYSKIRYGDDEEKVYFEFSDFKPTVLGATSFMKVGAEMKFKKKLNLKTSQNRLISKFVMGDDALENMFMFEAIDKFRIINLKQNRYINNINDVLWLSSLYLTHFFGILKNKEKTYAGRTVDEITKNYNLAIKVISNFKGVSLTLNESQNSSIRVYMKDIEGSLFQRLLENKPIRINTMICHLRSIYLYNENTVGYYLDPKYFDITVLKNWKGINN